ncbi:ATP-binding cassette domain-containing protein [Flavobacteriaceae bacterium R38]|nr:ATP-binding cassette domain-containing protein [Flavobacteriaceae bacterium R38]
MNTTEKNSVLEVQNLSIGYKAKKKATEVAQNINFSLASGELIAIVGANGVGKSTLLRTLANIQPNLSGTIFLNQKELSSYKSSLLATSLSLVLTEQLPTRNLTVKEIIALGRQPHTNWIGTFTANDIKHVKNAMELINISDLQEKKCFELSDGQMQKVLIARALAQDTSLIILDEPTTHLDIYHKAYILKILKRISEETNKTILFSTHEIDLAIQLCDKMVVMNNNEVLFDTPEQLIEKGSFSKLFPNDLINFDKKTQTFKVNK